MRTLFAMLTAGLLVPAHAVAQEEESYCSSLIEMTSEVVPAEDEVASDESQRGLTQEQRKAVLATLDAARLLEESDPGSCLTIVNAAQTVMAARDPERGERGRGVVDPGEFPYDTLYENAWRAEALIGRTANNEEGERVGGVRDILMTPDGRITAIVVKGGGFLGIGDSEVRVAWDEVRFTEDGEGVIVPLNPDEMTNLSLFSDDPTDEARIRSNEVRMTSILSDQVRNIGGEGYGFVEDILVSDGKAVATVVRPDVTYGIGTGTTATPFYAYDYGYSPGYDFYYMPYSPEQLARLENFDLERIGGPDALRDLEEKGESEGDEEASGN